MSTSDSAKELLELLASQREKPEQGASEIPQKLVEMLLARPTLTAEETVTRLSRAYGLWQEAHKFKAGEIVKWKTGLRNKRFPNYGDPAIVMESLEVPIVNDSKGAGTPYFRENLDILLGVIDPDGDFITFHYDSRRFEPWK
jgi:hypothetical protein